LESKISSSEGFLGSALPELDEAEDFVVLLVLAQVAVRIAEDPQ